MSDRDPAGVEEISTRPMDSGGGRGVLRSWANRDSSPTAESKDEIDEASRGVSHQVQHPLGGGENPLRERVY
ncbi:unnamed protein product [Amaranthus hypochondriacus]